MFYEKSWRRLELAIKCAFAIGGHLPQNWTAASQPLQPQSNMYKSGLQPQNCSPSMYSPSNYFVQPSFQNIGSVWVAAPCSALAVAISILRQKIPISHSQHLEQPHHSIAKLRKRKEEKVSGKVLSGILRSITRWFHLQTLHFYSTEVTERSLKWAM